ncbi:MAG TPA: hypothetical protein PLV87_13275 [Opitutaceae bacterium]|nr:hypothetical protein [Opitutaceae bacterium]
MGRPLNLRIMRHFRLRAVDLLQLGGDLGRRLQQVLQFLLQLLATTFHGLLPE